VLTSVDISGFVREFLSLLVVIGCVLFSSLLARYLWQLAFSLSVLRTQYSMAERNCAKA
jgi:hypothetical protein